MEEMRDKASDRRQHDWTQKSETENDLREWEMEGSHSLMKLKSVR